ncbi:MAG TPA: DUF11 domain-containing protein, partial [Tissierellia bacterium]|nr:DUF11 domain-containing protein [Tissierellia bacterium]
DRFFKVGDEINYTVEVVNTGQVDIEDLVIEDTLVPFEDMTLVESLDDDGVLQVGETWTLTYTYIITEDDVAAGEVLNVVTVSDPENPEEPIDDEEPIYKPSYTVEKTSDTKDYAAVGDEIDYTIEVVNTGEVAIEDLVIEDTLVPFEDMTLVESLDDDGVLQVGETWTLSYTYTVTEEDVERGHVLNIATVTDPENPEEPIEDEEEIPLEELPGWTVEKTSEETSFEKVGDELHYTVVVKNTGNVTINDLIIEDTLVAFEDMTLVESKIQDGHLQIGEVWTLTYTYEVTQEDIERGHVLNVARAMSPEYPDNEFEDEHKVTYKSPKIDITVNKKWVGGPAEKPAIHVQLLRDGKPYGDKVKLHGTTTYTWKDLDQTDGNGKAYVYTVEEVTVPNSYKVSYSKDTLTITNTWKKEGLPSTGVGSNIPLLFTGFGLLMVTGYLGIKRKRQEDK